MCEHGDTLALRVPVPASLSFTGQFRWDQKPVDSCIATIVSALNRARIYTANSCCGHGNGPGCIVLHDGRELVIKQQEWLGNNHG